MEMAELKAAWNLVLDDLEQNDRVAWLTFFDARLATLIDNELKLDFADPEKFSGGHDFQPTREKFLPLLKSAIKKITGNDLEVSW